MELFIPTKLAFRRESYCSYRGWIAIYWTMYLNGVLLTVLLQLLWIIVNTIARLSFELIVLGNIEI